VKVTIDKGLCSGHGRCYALAPEVFEPDEDGFSVVTQQDVPSAFEAAVRLAEQNCPEGAVTIS
jgi:ferredoxin